MLDWRKKRVGKGKTRKTRRLFGRSAGKATWSRAQVRLLRGLLLVVSVAVALCGLTCGVRHWLLTSGQFTLQKLEIESGDTMRSDLIVEYLKLTNNMPLFAINLKESHNRLMQNAAIQSLSICRQLPDKLTIRIVERAPLARFARLSLVVDAEGVIFPCFNAIDLLPGIRGFEANTALPGAQVEGMARAAIELLVEVRNQYIPLDIVEIDVAHEDYLLCTMSDQRSVKLAWKRMLRHDNRSRRQLAAQLQGLAQAMNSERGRTRSRWDATIPGRAYAL